jgi:25S rRNA (adenine2142-N1)-methyltransferase
MARHRPAYEQRKKERKKVKLTHGRPPLAPKQQPTLSKKATQTAIRGHHELNKKVAKARKKRDQEKVVELLQQFNQRGGLEKYQTASLQGQANDRGGDSSKILVGWLEELKPTLKSAKLKLRMLEVGALSTQNACSKSGFFDMTRIDLEAQSDGITKQDFMQRPIPEYDKEQFDIISLSLVLNYVPDAKDRGEMLKHTAKFLDKRAPRTFSKELQDHFPALFLVLPASCVMNSRYMNEEQLTLMMASLGYVLLNRKQTAKLVYYLWLLRDRPVPKEQNFAKREIHAGGQRNNFSIVLMK